jgi:hypothetical protein
VYLVVFQHLAHWGGTYLRFKCWRCTTTVTYKVADGGLGFLCNVFIVAQSVGTQHLAERFEAYARAHPPRGVVFLSNLLDANNIDVIAAPVHIIISDSEPDVHQLGRVAAKAHRNKVPFGASYYIAEHTEHTLFDTRSGPIDWNDPEWPQRYHRGAMQSLIDWLDDRSVVPESCP